MIGTGIFPNSLRIFFIAFILSLSPNSLLYEDKKQPTDCLNKAFERIEEIRSLPEMQYLHTLDNQYIQLNEFYTKCRYLFPQCCLFRKYYYWPSEIREVVSNTKTGIIRHRIRCYHNCLSTFCPEHYDSLKTHGDVAEFYDAKGNFMGLAVYMGGGNYCPLPYGGYKK